MESALKYLIKEGSRRDATKARKYLIRNQLDAVGTGKVEWGRGVIWVQEVESAGYHSGGLNIGQLSFSCVDFGDNVKLSVALTRRLGITGNFETNRCDTLHLAAALEWLGQGKPKRVPNRGHIGSLATELRGWE